MDISEDGYIAPRRFWDRISEVQSSVTWVDAYDRSAGAVPTICVTVNTLDFRKNMNVSPIMKKLRLSIAALVLFLGIPAAWDWYSVDGPGYYAEFNSIIRITTLVDSQLHDD